jgi:hypothetical protein
MEPNFESQAWKEIFQDIAGMIMQKDRPDMGDVGAPVVPRVPGRNRKERRRNAAVARKRPPAPT